MPHGFPMKEQIPAIQSDAITRIAAASDERSLEDVRVAVLGKKGTLTLDIRPMAARGVTITVTDDGIGRKRSASMKTRNQQRQQSKGMGNIRKRIEILNRMYGDRITVSVYDLNPDGSGTKVVLNLRND